MAYGLKASSCHPLIWLNKRLTTWTPRRVTDEILVNLLHNKSGLLHNININSYSEYVCLNLFEAPFTLEPN